jgi:hypothetical protein
MVFPHQFTGYYIRSTSDRFYLFGGCALSRTMPFVVDHWRADRWRDRPMHVAFAVSSIFSLRLEDIHTSLQNPFALIPSGATGFCCRSPPNFAFHL